MNKPALDIKSLPTWDLSDLYPTIDHPTIEDDFTKLKALADDFASTYKGNLDGLDAENILAALKAYEVIEDLSGKLGSYAYLQYAGDMTDSKIGQFFQMVQEKLNQISSGLLFFSLELNKIEDKQIENWLATSEELARYRTWFKSVRQYRPHQLEERLEELLHDKSVAGRSAWVRLFDETMASLKYQVTNPDNGDVQEMNTEETLDWLSDTDPAKRQAAAHALSKTFGENIRLFCMITNTLAKDKEIEDRWRKFEDPALSRHLSNQVEADVVAALVSAVRESYPRLSHRYYSLKAKWFGVDQLNWWDRNAPLPGSDDKIHQWPDAVKTVLKAYGEFSPKLAELGKKFFDNDWIDVPARPGKAGGAFAHPTVPSAHPYLMLNYLGKTRDVMTLAHELGHGVHQVLAADQGAILADTPLTLAETASVFGEMLTYQSLLKNEQDPALKRLLIAGKVEDMLNTVVRQIAFYEFETEVHNTRKKRELSEDDLADIWMRNQQESLGPAIKLDDDYRNFWTYIPHFIHSPFYVYAYAFGDCLVNSLYTTYLDQPDGFQEKYFEMLKAGGSLGHKELLKPFNLDATHMSFWQKGLNLIENNIDLLERDSI